jgi:hypothetical protein
VLLFTGQVVQGTWKPIGHRLQQNISILLQLLYALPTVLNKELRVALTFVGRTCGTTQALATVYMTLIFSDHRIFLARLARTLRCTGAFHTRSPSVLFIHEVIDHP